MYLVRTGIWFYVRGFFFFPPQVHGPFVIRMFCFRWQKKKKKIPKPLVKINRKLSYVYCFKHELELIFEEKE